jgi:sulfatase maturation enzyme AslB (radical SAM superfamily)
MKVNPKVFCNSPWYELHIYWNGDLGFCCQMDPQPYKPGSNNPYNVARMSIKEFYNSQPMKDARMRMFADERWNPNCESCWKVEDLGRVSRRHHAIQKSVIFNSNFQESFEQSPGYDSFKHSYDHQGDSAKLPVDLHIDLGNYCNLACKHCWSGASSKIEAQQKVWGINDSDKVLHESGDLKWDWTKDDQLWNQVLTEISEMPINNIHFMGGETVIQKRFEDFLDFMIDAERFDLNFSFVSNGTKFNHRLVEKLKKFQRVGIEISIETTTESNRYMRQGTDTQEVMRNIDLYLEHLDERLDVTVRPALNILTIRDFHTLLRYCLEKNLLVKGNLVIKPKFLSIRNLPRSLRQQYRQPYEDLLNEIDQKELIDMNYSDRNNYLPIIANYAKLAIETIDTDDNIDADEQLEKLVDHMKRWDEVYEYDARLIYPEWREILDRYGY